MSFVGDVAIRSDITNVAMNDGFSRKSAMRLALDMDVEHERSVGREPTSLAKQGPFTENVIEIGT